MDLKTADYWRRLKHRIPFYYRASTAFRDNYRFLRRCEKWDAERVREWTFRQLSSVIMNAYDNVPFYTKLYKKHGFHPSNFRRLDDLGFVPVISKQDVKNNLDDFVSKKHPANRLITAYTGGSTGTPMRFFLDAAQEQKELSYFYYMWRKLGYKIGCKCIFLKGDNVADESSRIFGVYDSKYNWLSMDSNYLCKKEYLPDYLDQIKAFDADVLFGFPSSIYQLARMIESLGYEAPRFRLILMASENTYPDQNVFIKNVFRADTLFYHYGHSEQVLLGFKCFHSDHFHFPFQYGYAEVLDACGQTIERAGMLGELVGTNYAYGMPFIRYRTNDYAVTSDWRCTEFPYNKTVQEIQGRLQEFIVTKDHRLVSICTMGAAHFASMREVIDSQYVQDKPGYLCFCVVENENRPLSKEQMSAIKIEVETKLEGMCEVQVRKVSKIERLPNRKKSMIIQRLDIAAFLN